jgi:hypothetical protein
MPSSSIASHIPGRLRLRADALRRRTTSDALASVLRSWEEVSQVEANPRTGGMLILYDRALGMEAFAARIAAVCTDLCGEAEPAPPRRKSKERLSFDLKDWNRTAKVGGLASMAALLAVLPASRAAHAALGVVHLAFLVLHLANHRKKLLQ